jgi:hypothetical protein
MKFYLIKYTCQVGEYEFSGQATLELRPRQRVETQVHRYFCDFYGKENLELAERGVSYLYNGGEVAVKRISYQEITAEQNAVLQELGV